MISKGALVKDVFLGIVISEKVVASAEAGQAWSALPS